jgi:hypothetical protein
MTPAAPRRSREEVAQLGQEIFDRVVRPKLTPEDDGKYVAIDIATERYEIDNSDYKAMVRLRGEQPPAHIWITRIGQPYRMSFRLRFPQ